MMGMGSLRAYLPKVVVAILCALLFLCAPVIAMRVAMTPYLFSDTTGLPVTDAVLIPGASVVRGHPSPVLALRADMGIALYNQKLVSRVLVTGDNGAHDYDEVTPVQKYLVAAGIPKEKIILDHAGFDTFSSVYRARSAYNLQSLVIVTQDFHLPRAVFIARMLGIKAHGISTTQGGTLFDYMREIPASWKAIWDLVAHRVPAYLDEATSLPKVPADLALK
jgi:SanA protein